MDSEEQIKKRIDKYRELGKSLIRLADGNLKYTGVLNKNGEIEIEGSTNTLTVGVLASVLTAIDYLGTDALIQLFKRVDEYLNDN